MKIGNIESHISVKDPSIDSTLLFHFPFQLTEQNYYERIECKHKDIEQAWSTSEVPRVNFMIR